MKGMPLPFENFEGKGVLLDLEQEISPHSNPVWKNKDKNHCLLGGFSEPTSVLDNFSSSPSPPTSTSTVSSSAGGKKGGADTAAAVVHHPLLPQSSAAVTAAEWEKVSSDSVAAASSPGQEPSILRLLMGDIDDPSVGLNQVLQIGAGAGVPPELEFSGGFGFVDQGFGLDSSNPSTQIFSSPVNFMPLPYKFSNPQTPIFTPSNNFPPISSSISTMNQPQLSSFDSADIKPHIFDPLVVINQNQSQPPQNPSFFFPLTQNQQEQQLLMPPQPKRHNSGASEPESAKVGPFLDPDWGLSPVPLPHYVQQRTLIGGPKKAAMDELGSNPHQQGIIDQVYRAADLIQSGSNLVIAQGILARLNHQLSPIGKPFQRAAFYFKEALQLLLHSILNNTGPPTVSLSSPFSLIFKIGAYKNFSEISPFVQFSNFTSNQAILEAIDGFNQVHVVDFDIGYGGQWASLMQEIALRSNNSLSLKITAFVSPSTHDQLELGLTRENLNHFAREINLPFEFEIVNVEALTSASWSLPIHVSENEAVAVNLPIGSIIDTQIPIPWVLHFVKNLSPKIIVSVDKGCDRTDLPYSNHIIHALQSYSNIFESLDAVNVNLDALQKIERFLMQPSIEKIVVNRFRLPEMTQHWREIFLSSGFSQMAFSNVTESQAECVAKRPPVRGFHVEKRQSSLVLYWQRRELVSVSAWRC